MWLSWDQLLTMPTVLSEVFPCVAGVTDLSTFLSMGTEMQLSLRPFSFFSFALSNFPPSLLLLVDISIRVPPGVTFIPPPSVEALS